ncbi:MAG: hypothetical protein CMH84_00715 [Nocardioides sp.]|jgi:hypothetical protein|uniref:Conjugal transfer protein TrbC n=1 Tax=Microbacterium ginsengisoli TaxID=400772 RepID=A0A0F0LXB8_9MICO|nr:MULTISPECIES: hypothetical protein [Micrococcales]KJL40882.1 hypothetical protein RR49_00385 [Microbacterium ginsengisoli]MAY95050.1 hypothetical protein [Nocardioides sp.]MEA1265142.1 hypothetical protein [Microbacterium sp. STF-2]MEE2524364.1 hypothetical protein [Pseudarthrobacter sp. J47]
MSTLHAILTAANDFAALLPQADIPNPAPVQPPGTNGFVTIMGWVKWVALAVCVIGIIVAGALMAINSRRGEGGEHAGRIGFALGGVIVISAAASLVGFLVS